MRYPVRVVLAVAALTALSCACRAHHSFAVYDFATEIEFEGVVDKLSFRNPHMSMTLLQTMAQGQTKTINFVEGAPANMLMRLGLKPEMIRPGTKIKAIGSPRKDNPEVFFLKAVILEDGRRFSALGPGTGAPRNPNPTLDPPPPE
jgi:hypothetical protein